MAEKKQAEYFNRELSWLEFNQRVLEEARDAETPMLERLKFLAISASNLDEFFMVRVGGLHMARRAGRRKRDPSGLTPLAQLKAIHGRAHDMMQAMHECFSSVVSPALADAGVRHVSMDSLDREQEAALHALFSEELFPVLTPMALRSGEPFPMLHNLALHVLVRLRSKRGKEPDDRYAVMALSRFGSRIVQVPAERGYNYVLREEVVKKYAGNWFPGYELVETALFRITRNADMAVQEDEAPDLLSGMEEVLEERKTGDCIRLEVESDISGNLLKFLMDGLKLEQNQVYRIDGILNLRDFMPLAMLEGFDELKIDAWPPQPSPNIIPNEPLFRQISDRDLLLYHPYETFDPVLRFVEEAADDPDVLAIKMVLYRISDDSSLTAALQHAAENGVNVTVLMELKARFDEARNIRRARDLEQSGVQVIHGVRGYKTHAKVCLVVRREAAGVVRYCHFGTGNYNESTARLYGDISYLTCNDDLAADASTFFNAICGYAEPRQFNRISMAPINMRDRLMELIDAEIGRARKGKKALIMAKFNSLADPALIRKLYDASEAGVKIRLNVRGICCLKPNENITVNSIVDRFLEHARILCFHHGGKPQVFIASADWMPRNLDKRLELMVPVENRNCRDQLIEYLKIHLADNQKSWLLQPDGTYERRRPGKHPVIRSQEELYNQACERIAAEQNRRRTRFEPHLAESFPER